MFIVVLHVYNIVSVVGVVVTPKIRIVVMDTVVIVVPVSVIVVAVAENNTHLSR